jgi:hypothetical protein
MPIATPSTGDGGVGTGPAVSLASPLYRQLPELAGWTTNTLSLGGCTVLVADGRGLMRKGEKAGPIWSFLAVQHVASLGSVPGRTEL